MALTTVEKKFLRMQEKQEQTAQTLQKLRKKIVETTRKRDNRRKILAGVVLLNLLRDDSVPQPLKDIIKERIKRTYPAPRDRKLFDNILDPNQDTPLEEKIMEEKHLENTGSEDPF